MAISSFIESTTPEYVANLERIFRNDSGSAHHLFFAEHALDQSAPVYAGGPCRLFPTGRASGANPISHEGRISYVDATGSWGHLAGGAGDCRHPAHRTLVATRICLKTRRRTHPRACGDGAWRILCRGRA